MISNNFQIITCDPSVSANQPNYAAKKYPCDGGFQFQHLLYTPKIEDNEKELSCSLDENGDNRADYVTSPVNIKVNQMTEVVKGIGPVDNTDNGDTTEELLVEFRDAWGEAHVHAGE